MSTALHHRLYDRLAGYRLRVAMDLLRRQVISRLRRGRADELALAAWCDVHVRRMRTELDRLCAAGDIRLVDGRYALPFNPLSPAGPVIIPQFRWHSTRLA